MLQQPPWQQCAATPVVGAAIRPPRSPGGPMNRKVSGLPSAAKLAAHRRCCSWKQRCSVETRLPRAMIGFSSPETFGFCSGFNKMSASTGGRLRSAAGRGTRPCDKQLKQLGMQGGTKCAESSSIRCTLYTWGKAGRDGRRASAERVQQLQSQSCRCCKTAHASAWAASSCCANCNTASLAWPLGATARRPVPS